MELKIVIYIVIGKFAFNVYPNYFTIHEQLDSSNIVIGQEDCSPANAVFKCLAFARRHGEYSPIKARIDDK